MGQTPPYSWIKKYEQNLTGKVVFKTNTITVRSIMIRYRFTSADLLWYTSDCLMQNRQKQQILLSTNMFES